VSRRDLAIDLGTANTLVYQHGQGIVFNEPTVVAMNTRTGELVAVGREAWDVAVGTPGNIVASRPLQRGAIQDFEITRQMLRLILQSVGVSRLAKPRVLVCVASMLTNVERRAVEEAVTMAGARSVSLVEEPFAAAVGAGLPIHQAVGSMVVDVGGGTSEMAVLAMGAIVTSTSVRVGGFDMDASIQAYVRETYDVAIGEIAAERLKAAVGSAYPAADAPNAEVTGRELSTGLPKAITITPDEIRGIIERPVESIVATTKECLSQSPSELAHDVLERGAFLTGGGGMLRGLAMRLAQDCEVPVHLTEHPLATVALGAGRLLDYLPEYQAAFLTG
jgi:rod shape-determining protein MreB and related proteins